ncbi:hypothetical protein E1N52_27065 [Paraburkholderia guartelaensis]|uniref:Uncharacterized protein n=1 Tax=Paraburkholderia guartelaensis TaxID=2546446 RepID=A0A4R5L839_9BURK|nr:hypothetical protein [Paraburkholderia guartelaensis]TDG05098.1 hypothetical protein E1N52_27065 [Paraburkholderia guartelaensis]
MNAPIPLPVATFQTADTQVVLYRNDDNYQFTVVVQGEQVSVGYHRGLNAPLHFTVYDGDPAFFRKLSMRQFHDVELGVWHCMRQLGPLAGPLASAEPQP